MMKSLKSFFYITVPTLVILFLLLELFFQLFVPVCDPPRYAFDDQDHLLKLDNHKKDGRFVYGKYSQYRSQWHINNHGWNSPIDYEEKRTPNTGRIAVIGDSYIEALQVNTDKSVASLLQKKLAPAFEVYSFGTSAAPLSQYLNISRYVQRRFTADILVINVVQNDFLASLFGQHMTGWPYLLVKTDQDSLVQEKTIEPDRALMRYQFKKDMIFRSALLRYVFLHLSILHLKDLFSSGSNGEMIANVYADKVDRKRRQIEIAIAYIFKRFRAENADKRIIVMMDAIRDDLYAGRDPHTNRLYWLTQLAAAECANNQIEFIDLTDAMETDYQRHHVMFNTETDGHWNEYGHQLAAELLYNRIKNP